MTPENPWDRFGQDIILGCAVDTPLTSRAELAFPFYTESILRRANVVRGSGERQALVSHDGYLVEVTPFATKATPFFTPLKAVWLLLLLACAAVGPNTSEEGGCSVGCSTFLNARDGLSGLLGLPLILLLRTSGRRLQLADRLAQSAAFAALTMEDLAG